MNCLVFFLSICSLCLLCVAATGHLLVDHGSDVGPAALIRRVERNEVETDDAAQLDAGPDDGTQRNAVRPEFEDLANPDFKHEKYEGIDSITPDKRVYGPKWNGMSPELDHVTHAVEFGPPKKVKFIHVPLPHDSAGGWMYNIMFVFAVVLLAAFVSEAENVKIGARRMFQQMLILMSLLLLMNFVRDLSDAVLPEDPIMTSHGVPYGGETLIQSRLVSASSQDKPQAAPSPNPYRVLFTFVIVFFTLIGLESALLFVKDEVRIHSILRFGSNAVGFLAAEAFGSLQETKPFSQSSLNSFGLACVVPLYWILCWKQLGTLRRRLMEPVVSADGTVDAEAQQHYIDYSTRCKEIETRTFAVSTGLVFVQSVKYAIQGVQATMHGPQKCFLKEQIGYLLVVTVMAGGASTVTLDNAAKNHFKQLSLPLRLRVKKIHKVFYQDLIAHATGFIFGWGTVYSICWILSFSSIKGGIIGGGNLFCDLVLFAILSTGVMAFILVYRPKMVKNDTFTMATFLTPSFLWNESLTMGCYGLLERRQMNKQEQMRMRIWFNAILFIVIFVLWCVYGLPVSLVQEAEREKELALARELAEIELDEEEKEQESGEEEDAFLLEEEEAGDDSAPIEEPSSSAPIEDTSGSAPADLPVADTSEGR